MNIGIPAIEWGEGDALNRFVFPQPLDDWQPFNNAPQAATTRSMSGRTEFTFFHMLQTITFSMQGLDDSDVARLQTWFVTWAGQGKPFRFRPVSDGDSFLTCVITPGWVFKPEWQVKFTIRRAAFSFINEDATEAAA